MTIKALGAKLRNRYQSAAKGEKAKTIYVSAIENAIEVLDSLASAKVIFVEAGIQTLSDRDE